MHSSEVIWAPHLIGVELIGASELISVFGRVNASVQGILGLEAELLVPTVLGGVMVSQESKPGVFVHHGHFNL